MALYFLSAELTKTDSFGQFFYRTLEKLVSHQTLAVKKFKIQNNIKVTRNKCVGTISLKTVTPDDKTEQ